MSSRQRLKKKKTLNEAFALSLVILKKNNDIGNVFISDVIFLHPGVEILPHAELKHRGRHGMTVLEDQRLVGSILLEKGTQIRSTESTGTIFTPRKRTTLVTMVTHSVPAKDVTQWAFIREQPAWDALLSERQLTTAIDVGGEFDVLLTTEI